MGTAEGSITVAKQMTWRFVPGKGISHLACEPFGSRIVRHADAHKSPAGVAKDYQAMEQLERDRVDDEQIQRSDDCGMIEQKRLTTLGRWTGALHHISAEGRYYDYMS